ncbi:hypothetical protein ABK040_004377 [Willaertia magna]
MFSKKDKTIKALLLGNTRVGKTSIIEKLVYDQFEENYTPTIGSDFLTSQPITSKNESSRLQIWDSAGLEKYQALSVAFYRDIDVVCLVYSVIDPQSAESLNKWREEFLVQAGLSVQSTFPMIVLANKVDLINPSNQTQVEKAMRIAKTFSSQYNYLHIELSAKKDTSYQLTNNVFQSVLEKAIPNTHDENDQEGLLTDGEAAASKGCCTIQ